MQNPHPGFLEVDDYVRLPRDKSWLIKPLLPTGGAAILYGAPKSGKSWTGIQLALAISGQSDEWLGFPVAQHGKVLYLQLDTPRSTWASRFDDLIKKHHIRYDSRNLLLADKECLSYYPLDILQLQQTKYLRSIVEPHNPVAVIIDTLRESHSGDEDNSTVSRNVVANLVGAVHPAALIIISHSRKPSAEMKGDLMSEIRGSSYVAGRMDVIMCLKGNKLHYQGRSIEKGSVRLTRLDSGFWAPAAEDSGPAIANVLADPSLGTLRAKARSLSLKLGKTEEACMSELRRVISKDKPLLLGESEKSDTAEVQSSQQVTAADTV